MCRTTIPVAALVIAAASAAGEAMAASTASRDAVCWKAGTTVSIANCFAASAKVSDARLNHLYGRIISVLNAGDRRRLQNAERFWVWYRGAACSAERALWDGGTGGNPAYLACIDDETRHHLDYLEATYRLRLQKLGR